MAYTVYKLKFSTGLHVGQDTGRPSLDDGRMTIHSDTLFAALCCEAVKKGQLAQLVNYFSHDVLAISDTFPFKDEELYLPKPVLFTGDRRREGEPGLRKKFKALEYIPLSQFAAYLRGLKGVPVDLDEMHEDFGSMSVVTKVAIAGQEQPQPYHQAIWRFFDGCGLYVIVRSQEERPLAFLIDLLAGLGLSGVGGKQSAGMGKFAVEEIPLPLELARMLENDRATWQMLLGTALPVDSELDQALDGGWYALIKRGGFVRSDDYAPVQLKKRSIYMLAPGSCLKRRFSGGIFDLSDNGAHSVWRCGHTLFAGVSL
jgi:CRISPR-associated protein Csm4